MAGGMDMGALMGQRMMEVANAMEDQVDAEIHKMEKMGENDFEDLKQKRLEALKKSQEQKQEWLKQGHGEYSEIPEEKAFFDVTKNSTNVVIHFYREETFRCRIFDKHLRLLAPKHVETKFCKIDADKCPFLTQRLRIKTIPTLALIKGGMTKDYVVGFSDLGNHDEFSTEMLEWRLGCAEIINYSGDLMTPPDQGGATNKKKITIHAKPKAKIIRGGRGRRNKGDDSSDDDGNDW